MATTTDRPSRARSMARAWCAHSESTPRRAATSAGSGRSSAPVTAARAATRWTWTSGPRGSTPHRRCRPRRRPGSARQHLGERIEWVARARRVAPVERVDLIETDRGRRGPWPAQVTPVEFHSCSAPSKPGRRGRPRAAPSVARSRAVVSPRHATAHRGVRDRRLDGRQRLRRARRRHVSRPAASSLIRLVGEGRVRPGARSRRRRLPRLDRARHVRQRAQAGAHPRRRPAPGLHPGADHAACSRSPASTRRCRSCPPSTRPSPGADPVAVVELAIPARPAYLSLVRLVVDAAVGSLAPGLSPARLDDLKIAVTEACANAIEAHETTDADGPVVVRCIVDDDHVTVEVVDRGEGFDPDRVDPAARGHRPAAPAPRERPRHPADAHLGRRGRRSPVRSTGRQWR